MRTDLNLNTLPMVRESEKQAVIVRDWIKRVNVELGIVDITCLERTIRIYRDIIADAR